LSRQLGSAGLDKGPPPAASGALFAPLGDATLAILQVALQRLRSMLAEGTADEDSLYLETDACRDGLVIAHCFQLAAVVEPAVQILRLFPPDLARGVGPLARQTGPLRQAASTLLGQLLLRYREVTNVAGGVIIIIFCWEGSTPGVV